MRETKRTRIQKIRKKPSSKSRIQPLNARDRLWAKKRPSLESTTMARSKTSSRHRSRRRMIWRPCRRSCSIAWRSCPMMCIRLCILILCGMICRRERRLLRIRKKWYGNASKPRRISSMLLKYWAIRSGSCIRREMEM